MDSYDTIQTPYCVGTRSIEIESKVDTQLSAAQFQPGMIAVYTEPRTPDGSSSTAATSSSITASALLSPCSGIIRILLTNGFDSFQGTLHVDLIKGERWDVNDDDDRSDKDDTTNNYNALLLWRKVDVITSYLLNQEQNPNMTVTYDMIFEPSESTIAPSFKGSRSIRVELSRRTVTGITARAYSTLLSRCTVPAAAAAAVGVKNWNNNNDTIVEPVDMGSIRFCQTLATAFEQQKCDMSKLQEELKKVQQDVKIWRDTAMKQQQAIQQRSDELLGNFLILYRATHQRLKRTEQMLQQQQQQRSKSMVESTMVMPHNVSSTLKRQRHHHPNVDVDWMAVPDDNDFEIYDSDTVDKLAAIGPRESNQYTVKRNDGKRSKRMSRPLERYNNNNNNNNNINMSSEGEANLSNYDHSKSTTAKHDIVENERINVSNVTEQSTLPLDKHVPYMFTTDNPRLQDSESTSNKKINHGPDDDTDEDVTVAEDEQTNAMLRFAQEFKQKQVTNQDNT